ncbi:hypothetical protein ABMA28_000737 [Loxostege sticticalis]|uniref:Odorant receptor n=1 Tax=Loxostege sticticalis TaxID=481309 RepID=A0ABD0T4Y3_LOXSC
MKILPKGIIKKCTQTVGVNNEIDEIMRLTLFFTRIFGHHILDPNWTWNITFPYQLATLLLISYVIVGTLEIIRGTNDVKLIAEAAYTFIVIVVMQTRFYFFLSTRKHFQHLYIQMKTTLYNSILDDPEKNLKDVLKKLRMVVNWMAFFLLMSKTTSILMPMRTPYYEIGLLLHSIFMFSAAFTIGEVEIWFVMMMIFFRTACDGTEKYLSVEARHENESQLDYAIRLKNSLRKFYKSHVKEIEFLNTLNAMFKWLGMMPLISVALCICLILLLLSKGIDMTFVSNVIPVIVELFVYNWFGEEIKIKAEKWKSAILEFDWLNLLPKDKKCYCILVCYMSKEFGIKIATGTFLSLLTMSASLKFSYQAFTVLQTMDI